MVSTVIRKIRPAFASVVLALVALSPLPAAAQDGLLMRNLFGNLGILPEEKEPIEYRERPGLVVPKDLNKLRTPEAEDAAKRQANGQWPKDPDELARERRREQKKIPIFPNFAAQATEGGRLSVDELARGRTARGTDSRDYTGVPRNDKDGVRLGIQEMTAINARSQMPSYPPGTEPPRRYLTDPPVGLRIPSAAAPVGRRTTEAPLEDDSRPRDVWRRLD